MPAAVAADPPKQPGEAASAEDEGELGRMAVENELISQAELDECLTIQRTLAEKSFRVSLGKILLLKRLVDRITVATLTRGIAKRRRRPDVDFDTAINLIKLTDAEHKILLTRARVQKLLTIEQIDECYDIVFTLERLGIDKQLGEVFLERGFLSRDVVADILKKEKREERKQEPRPPKPAEKPAAGAKAAPAPVAEPRPLPPPIDDDDDDEAIAPGGDLMVIDLDFQSAVGDKVDVERIRTSRQVRFGQLAVEKKLCTQEQVDDAIYAQFRLKELGIQRRIGEILIEKKVLKPPQVRRILDLQKEKMNQLSFADVHETHRELSALPEADQNLASTLIGNGIVSQQEIDECLFVLKSMHDLGIEQPLGKVLVEKGYVDDVIVKGVYRQFEKKKAADGAPDDAARKKPVPADSSRLKSTALASAYKDVLEKLGIEEEEEVVAKPAGLIELRGGRIRRSARDERRLLQRPVLVAAGIAFFVVSSLFSGLLISRLDEEPRTVHVAVEATPQEASSSDKDAFAKRMAARGLVFRNGQWVKAGESDTVHVPSSIQVPEEQRRQFSREMERNGYVQVADGSWIDPQAYRKLEESREKAAEGLVRVDGRYRPTDAPRPGDPPREGSPPLPVEAGPATEGVTRIDVQEKAFLRDLDAAFLIERARTRIYLRFRSELPANVVLLASVATPGEEQSAFFTTVFQPNQTDTVELEIPAVPYVLPPGLFRVRVVCLPEAQPAALASRIRTESRAEDDVVLGDESAVVQRRDEQVKFYAGVHKRLATVQDILAEIGDDTSGRRNWAREQIIDVVETLNALLRIGTSQPVAELREIRDRLISACRALIDSLANVTAAKKPEAAVLESTKESLDGAAAALAAAVEPPPREGGSK